MHRRQQPKIIYLKLVLVASDRGSLLVPKVVRLDNNDVLHVCTKVLLQNFENCFDTGHVVAVATHVDQNRKTDRFG